MGGKRCSAISSVIGLIRDLAEDRWKHWCPGRESYATTDTTKRCLSLVWWHERLALVAEARYTAVGLEKRAEYYRISRDTRNSRSESEHQNV